MTFNQRSTKVWTFALTFEVLFFFIETSSSSLVRKDGDRRVQNYIAKFIVDLFVFGTRAKPVVTHVM